MFTKIIIKTLLFLTNLIIGMIISYYHKQSGIIRIQVFHYVIQFGNDLGGKGSLDN